MTLSISNEIPENVKRGLVAKGEGATREECADIAKISRYELQQWRAHPDADNLISTAINYNLEEALGTIAAAAPTARPGKRIAVAEGARRPGRTNARRRVCKQSRNS